VAAKPTLFDLADYFQQQANRARKEERKAHYQRCADQYRLKAQQAEAERRPREQSSSRLSSD